jgi:rhamnulokinase
MRIAAVDLGASSGRVAVFDASGDAPSLEVVRRFANGPVRSHDGSLRWDWRRLVRQVELGLEDACATGPLASIGIDAWGVDYGLLDRHHRLLSPPYSYRDGRTAGWRSTLEGIGATDHYRITGIQAMPINTIFQLAAHPRHELGRAQTLLMVPELIVHHLTGVRSGERTSAATTGLVDATSGSWSHRLCEAIGLDPAILPPIATPGEPAGTWRGVPVHLVAGHDSASAVGALPTAQLDRTLFVATGTWMLAGTCVDHPVLTEVARRANLSNEAGAAGGFRLVRNVGGLWILDRCLEERGNPPLAPLLHEARGWPADRVFDVTDERFLAPPSMVRAVREASGLGRDVQTAAMVRCIIESLVASVLRVAGDVERATGRRHERVAIVGGGVNNPLLCERLRDTIDLPTSVGRAEATLVGNALVQAVALGRWSSLDEARIALATGMAGTRP